MLRLLVFAISSLLLKQTVFSQENSDCARYRVITSSSYAAGENWKEATAYFIKAEAACPEFGKDNYDRLLSCVQKVIENEEDKSVTYYAYLDTLMFVWERAEDKGHYDPVDDISRGYHYTILKNPNYEKADFYMSRGIKMQGTELEDEVYLLLYYYNIYSLWYTEQDAVKKDALKQRFIQEYFELTKLINATNFSQFTQETLTQYLAQVITSCEDLEPMIPGFLESLPEAPEDKKKALTDMYQLLIDQGCKEKDFLQQLTDSTKKYDPMAFDQWPDPIPFTERILIYKEIKEKTLDPMKKNEIQFNIAACYMKIGSYNDAYVAAKSVTGNLRSRALRIQASCVAATANVCGESTYERKCNYVYAAQLLEEAGLDGSKYRILGPEGDISTCFSTITVTLPCWGVEVIVCQ
ncbi:MAG: hypothetical protein ACFHU9_15145 [Fluviicola sp.]